jgi:flavodoxin
LAKNFRTLVVSFSRTGQTQKVAQLISDTLQADKQEQIGETSKRLSPLGYARSAWEALVGSSPLIQRPHFDPSEFDMVVLAAPVWMGRIASPMRTYLLKMELHLPRVAFVVTEGGSGGNRALLQMRDLCSKIPLVELVLTEDEIRRGSHIHKVKTFCEQLKAQYEKEVVPISMTVKKGAVS